MTSHVLYVAVFVLVCAFSGKSHMPFWIYILRSESTGRHYCGSTEDVERRVSEHNDPTYHGSKTTKRFPGPCRVIWTREHETRGEAMALE